MYSSTARIKLHGCKYALATLQAEDQLSDACEVARSVCRRNVWTVSKGGMVTTRTTRATIADEVEHSPSGWTISVKADVPRAAKATNGTSVHRRIARIL